MTMTNDSGMHTPSPEFRERLEWELVHAFRREQRLDDNRRRTLRRMRAAAVIVVCIAIGATAGFAPAQIRDGARRDSLLQSARGDLDLAMLRLQLARENLADIQRKVDAGVLGESSLAGAVSELRTMEAKIMRARYDTEEIAATSQSPRDDLNSPLVNDRDFVKDRLQLDLLAAQQRLTAAEQGRATALRKILSGVTMSSTRLDAEGELVRARALMEELATKLKLREEFVQKGTAVQELQRRLDALQLRIEAEASQRLLLLERERLALLEKQFSVGAVDELEVMKARLEVREREVELQRLAQRLRGK
jgi:hypothetical protein